MNNKSGMKVTKRDVYYMDTQLFVRQKVVDNLVDELARCLDIPRDSLGILASAKGIAYGHLSLKTPTGSVDYRNIPVVTDHLESSSIEDAPQAVLIIEKEAVFRTLQQSYPDLSRSIPGLLLVTGKGYPCMPTMKFIHFLYKQLAQCTFYILVDYDPYGLNIALQYRMGCKLPADQPITCCPSLRLMGVTLNDLDHYANQFDVDKSRHPLSQQSMKMLHRVKKISKEKGWDAVYKTADDMIAGGFCTEIESLYQQDTIKLVDYIVNAICGNVGIQHNG